MTYEIVITPVAQNHIEDAINYYKNKASNKVAGMFIDDYKKTFRDIQKVLYFKIFFENFRGKPMKKFPFIVFYTLDEQQKIIFIKAVFNTHQDTNKYPKS
ncbi:MAG: type II toxin-antitoxin system RelE/ParE family toxin [Moheibacter sp.]